MRSLKTWAGIFVSVFLCIACSSGGGGGGGGGGDKDDGGGGGDDRLLTRGVVSPEQGALLQVADDDDEVDGAALDIPPGAVDEDLEVTIGLKASSPSQSPFGQVAVGRLFYLEPAGAAFDEEVLLSLPVAPGCENPNLYIGTWNETENTWEDLGGTVGGDFISTPITHFSTFGVFERGKSLVRVVNEVANPPDHPELAIEITYMGGPMPPPDWPAGEPFPAPRPLPREGVYLEYGEATTMLLLAGRYHFQVSYPTPRPGVANSLYFTIPNPGQGADDAVLDQTLTITFDGANSSDPATDASIDFPGRTTIPGSNLGPSLSCDAVAPAGVPVSAALPGSLSLPSRFVEVGPVRVEQLLAGGALTLTGTAVDPEGDDLLLVWIGLEGQSQVRFDAVPSGGETSDAFVRDWAGRFPVYLVAYDGDGLFDQCQWNILAVPNNRPEQRVVPDDACIDFGRKDDIRELSPLTNDPTRPLRDAIPYRLQRSDLPWPILPALLPNDNVCTFVDTTADNIRNMTYLRSLITVDAVAGQTPSDHCDPTQLSIHNHAAHPYPTQHPCGLTCVFNIVADIDGDPLASNFQFPTTLFGDHNLYAALPVPDAANGGLDILLSGGRTVADVLPRGLVAGSMIHNQDELDAYNATLTALANAGLLPVTGESALVFPPEDLRHERINSSDHYLIAFRQGGPTAFLDDVTLDEDQGGQDTTGDGLIDTGIPGETVQQVRGDGNTVSGRVHKVVLSQGNWAQGTAAGYLWLTEVASQPAPWLGFDAGGDLLVEGSVRGQVAAIGQALPILYEAPDNPVPWSATNLTHDCRHPEQPDPCSDLRGGLVQLEARTSDGLSRERRDFGAIQYPDPLAYIELHKTVDPPVVDEPGPEGVEVEYTITVTNTSVGSAWLYNIEIRDPDLGITSDDDVREHCDVGLSFSLAPGEVITCTVPQVVTGVAGDVIENIAVVWATDDCGNLVTSQDYATVTIVSDCSSQIMRVSEAPPIDFETTHYSDRATNSANGSTVAYQTRIFEYEGGYLSSDVFVADLAGGDKTLVSVSADGQTRGGRNPSLSGDGRYVVFSSLSALLPEDSNELRDVYRYDREAEMLSLVSVSSSGAAGNGSSGYGGFRPPGASHYPSRTISGDGRYIVFTSSATNLAAGDTDGEKDIFLRDTTTGTTTLVTGGSDRDRETRNPAISPDGRFIAYELVGPADFQVVEIITGVSHLYVYDRVTGQHTRECYSHWHDCEDCGLEYMRIEQGCAAPALSEDGEHVVFLSYDNILVRNYDCDPDAGCGWAGDPSTGPDVYIRDVDDSDRTRNTMVSVSSDWEFPNHIESLHRQLMRPSISGDGRFVAFSSHASNLVADDPDDVFGRFHIFVRDTATGQTARASVSEGGQLADGNSYNPQLSQDGRCIVFESSADNLVPGEETDGWHVYSVPNPLYTP